MQKLILQLIYSFFVRWFLKIIVGVRFTIPKFLINEKQFIIVANHNSHLDTLSILAAVPSKIIHKIKPVAASDHFGRTRLKEKLSNYFVNTLLIQRGRDQVNPENDPINKMLKAIDEGYSLILFPEGTRGKPEEEAPLKKGIGIILSQRPEIKFIPAYMKGMGKAMPKDDSLIVPFNSSLTFGKPTKILSKDVVQIVEQIKINFDQLKEKTI
ncbi:1-acyl-sn-glycerol-3-phosphate acyltransferase [Oceanihabitans sp.]|nr:1-acyl-sn-glycerol-3-phosphate acyltransferase [Oceanihabitans sp.]